MTLTIGQYHCLEGALLEPSHHCWKGRTDDADWVSVSTSRSLSNLKVTNLFLNLTTWFIPKLAKVYTCASLVE